VPAHTSTERLLSARADEVFGCIRDPESLARWWGPRGFTNTFHEFEFRPGALWRYQMNAPNGAVFPNESEFVEIVPNERVVIRHRSSPAFDLTITLTPEGESTRLGWFMEFKTDDLWKKAEEYVPAANEENLDRLEAELKRKK
jgi:uncharacterized protein YndB with AHSA1/START domain